MNVLAPPAKGNKGMKGGVMMMMMITCVVSSGGNWSRLGDSVSLGYIMKSELIRVKMYV
jgi:hypothetical protein